MSQIGSKASAENRPKLWRYYREQDFTVIEVARAFGRSREWVRRVCLPFGHPDRLTPSEKDVVAAYEWSRGEIGPADWYPPGLSANLSGLPEELAS